MRLRRSALLGLASSFAASISLRAAHRGFYYRALPAIDKFRGTLTIALAIHPSELLP